MYRSKISGKRITINCLRKYEYKAVVPRNNRNHTGSPSSKIEQGKGKSARDEVAALLRNIRNIRICMGKKPVTEQGMVFVRARECSVYFNI